MTTRTHVQHHIRETSIKSWLTLEKLGERQRLIYDHIKQLTKIGVYPTDRELADALGFKDPNSVRPRRYELMKMKLIKEAGRRSCMVTHKLAITWRAVDVEPVVLFQGDKARQLKYLSKPQWIDLAKVMESKGYRYLGQGVWTK